MIALDSSFLIAYHNKRDSQHAAALAGMEQFLSGKWGGGLLLEYVFLEVVTVLLVRRDLSVAGEVGRILLEAEELELVPCSDFFLETSHTFLNQQGTSLSFADAAIVTVARKRSEGLVATFDREFTRVRGISVVPAGARVRPPG